MQTEWNYSGCGYSALQILFVSIVLAVTLMVVVFAVSQSLETGFR